MKTYILISAYAAMILALVACVTLTDEQREQIEELVGAIPTPTATPSPTPLPTPTPKPADVSMIRIQRDLPGYAANKGLPVTNTSRGVMLDMRGRADFDAVFSEWCQFTGGAALPALTDSEPRGVFHQCQ